MAEPPVDFEARVLQRLQHDSTWLQVESPLGGPRAVVARCARRLAAIETAQSQAGFVSNGAATFTGGETPTTLTPTAPTAAAPCDGPAPFRRTNQAYGAVVLRQFRMPIVRWRTAPFGRAKKPASLSSSVWVRRAYENAPMLN